MTITPVPLRPAASGSSGSPGRPDRTSGDPEGFAALVSQETDRLAGCACDGTSADAAGPGGPDDGTADSSAGTVPAGAAVPGVVPPLDAVVAVAPGRNLLGDSETTHGGPGELAADGTGAPKGAQPDVGTALTTAVAGSPTDQATRPGAGVVTPPSGGGAAEPGRADSSGASPTPVPADGTPGATADGTGEGPDVSEPGAAAPSPGVSTSAAGTTSPAGPDAVGAPATGSTGVAGAEAASDPTPTTQPGRSTAALLDQVTPTLTRLVTRGDGEHRMALKIHPAELGEVHLSVTVRGDRVDVEIAASAEARELLRDGLTQLRALLDPTGRGGGQLVFRDLPTAPTAGHSVSAEAGTGGDQGSRSGSAGADGSAENHDGRSAQTGHHAVRTGSPGEPAARTPTPTRPGGPGTRTVDLTI